MTITLLISMVLLSVLMKLIIGSLVVMVEHLTINHTPFSVRERMLTTTLETVGLCHLVCSAALFIMFTNILWNVFSGVMSRGIIEPD